MPINIGNGASTQISSKTKKTSFAENQNNNGSNSMIHLSEKKQKVNYEELKKYLIKEY